MANARDQVRDQTGGASKGVIVVDTLLLELLSSSNAGSFALSSASNGNSNGTSSTSSSWSRGILREFAMLRGCRIRATLAGVVLGCGGRVESGESNAFDVRCLPGAQLECSCLGGTGGT